MATSQSSYTIFMPDNPTLEDLERFLDGITQLCQQLKRTRSSSVTPRFDSTWTRLKDYASFFVDGLSENLTMLTNQDPFLSLLSSALGEISGLTWFPAALTLLAWSLQMIDTASKVSENCLEVLSRAILLMKYTKRLWAETIKGDHVVEELQNSIKAISRCAILCVWLSRKSSTWISRWLKSKDNQEFLSRASKNLNIARDELTLFVTRDVQTERTVNIERQLEYSPSRTVGGDQVENEALNILGTESDEIVAVCVHGMGGIGKSTIGMNVFANFQARNSFKCCNVELRLEIKRADLPNVQKQILNKLRGRASPEFSNCTDGKKHLKNELAKITQPIFLFLDNVLDESHPFELLPEAVYFPKCSRILVTTRHEGVCFRMKRDLKIQDCRLVKVELLDEAAAKELLWKQMEQDRGELNAEMIELEEQLLELCDGLPLALILAGNYIACKRDSACRIAKVWKNVIESMSNAVPLSGSSKEDEIDYRFKFSIDDLDPRVRMAFFDIIAVTLEKPLLWEYAECVAKDSGCLENLRARALVMVVEGDFADEDLSMDGFIYHRFISGRCVAVHDVVKALGLRIAELDKSELRVVTEEALYVIQEEKRLHEVVGLVNVIIDAELLCEMPRLRFIVGVETFGSKMERKPEKAKLKHLLVMLPGNNELFTFVDLTSCKDLRALGGEMFLGLLLVRPTFDEWEMLKSLQKIEVLDVDASDLHDLNLLTSFTQLKRLLLKNLRFHTLPHAVSEMMQLESLFLWNCDGLVMLPEGTTGWTSLRKLFLVDCTSLTALPTSARAWTSLQDIYLKGCCSLREVPDGAREWSSLKWLDLSDCMSLQALPEGVAGWTSLQELYLCSTGLKLLPEGAGGWKSLRELRLDGCSSLQALPEGAGGWKSLRELRLDGCSSLQALPEGLSVVFKHNN